MEQSTILVSTVNLSEVATKLARGGMQPSEVSGVLEPFLKSAQELTLEQAMLAAEIDRITQPIGLSLGDRVCLALALSRGALVLTTDRAWKSVQIGVQVRLLR